MKILLGDFSAK